MNDNDDYISAIFLNTSGNYNHTLKNTYYIITLDKLEVLECFSQSTLKITTYR